MQAAPSLFRQKNRRNRDFFGGEDRRDYFFFFFFLLSLVFFFFDRSSLIGHWAQGAVVSVAFVCDDPIFFFFSYPFFFFLIGTCFAVESHDKDKWARLVGQENWVVYLLC